MAKSEPDTSRPMFDQNNVVLHAGDIVAFDDDLNEEYTAVGWDSPTTRTAICLSRDDDDDLYVADRKDLVALRRMTNGPFTVGDEVVSEGAVYYIERFELENIAVAWCVSVGGSKQRCMNIDDLTLVEREPDDQGDAERAYKEGDVVYHGGTRHRIDKVYSDGSVALESEYGHFANLNAINLGELSYDDDSQVWAGTTRTPAPTPTPAPARTPSQVAAMVTQATPDNLVCGMVVLPKVQPKSRKVHFRSGRLWVVAAYLKQTDTWKCCPVNGETYVGPQGQDIQIFAKMDARNLQIVRVKGEM